LTSDKLEVAGLRGLYRGLGSNLASSAPTSAIYTFTYEAVKLGLLPFIPQVDSWTLYCSSCSFHCSRYSKSDHFQRELHRGEDDAYVIKIWFELLRACQL
jgi:hypothetical protein